MKKNWKKAVSVLLLAALLYALPGTLAWGTDISAITPDGPAESQTGGNQTSGTSQSRFSSWKLVHGQDGNTDM